MKPSLYIETSVVSYCTSRHSRDMLVLSRQEITHDWWEKKRNSFTLYISELVIQEISVGDPVAAEKRLDFIQDIPLLSISSEIENLAYELIELLEMPEKAITDALHLAVASFHNMDFLVTWNCKHIANPFIIKRLNSAAKSHDIHVPVICTPIEFMEEL